ncbi:hypothetical protein TIFTF001_050536 [Ficus carica]|uniref:Uncharacterized protein n=1 Tax=Ficus carica TaxID=3494 RepID=A0AA88CRF0_FICCA|nr:hypothetical protein TIFTF001_050531 [Ficus carica]GMN28375.1 hypothetical protein TIFTF001_050536 [Ficus carica]
MPSEVAAQEIFTKLFLLPTISFACPPTTSSPSTPPPSISLILLVTPPSPSPPPRSTSPVMPPTPLPHSSVALNAALLFLSFFRRHLYCHPVFPSRP